MPVGETPTPSRSIVTAESWCFVCARTCIPDPLGCSSDCLNDNAELELADHYERTNHD